MVAHHEDDPAGDIERGVGNQSNIASRSGVGRSRVLLGPLHRVVIL